MNRLIAYPYSIGKAFISLLIGMHRTVHSMIHPKLVLTQQYPNNRDVLYIPSSFKAMLEFSKDENGVPKCTACGLCQMSCPNGSISLTSCSVVLEDGRSKKQIETYNYNLGSCTFCGLCIDSCRFGAIEFNNKFEQSQYIKENLKVVLYKKTTNKTEK